MHDTAPESALRRPLAPAKPLPTLYAELAARERELTELRARLAGLRAFAFRVDPVIAAERQPFDLMAAVEAALDSTRADLGGNFLSLHVPPVQVYASLAAITQVLVHLLVNAATAMRGTGRPGVLHLDAAVLGSRVRVRVSDNGPGVAPGVLGQLFEPYTSRRGAGLELGLGLTISSAIVRAHGGTLTCSNRIPHGARFAFDLLNAQVNPADATLPEIHK